MRSGKAQRSKPRQRREHNVPLSDVSMIKAVYEQQRSNVLAPLCRLTCGQAVQAIAVVLLCRY
jgi:hypothetical protein